VRKLPVAPLEVLKSNETRHLVGIVMFLPSFAEAGRMVDWPILVNYN
jgi:hypothetical protein